MGMGDGVDCMEDLGELILEFNGECNKWGRGGGAVTLLARS